MSNLVVYCNRRDTADRITAQIPEIGAVHPSRVLLLIGECDGDNLKAWVRVRAEGVGQRAMSRRSR